MDPVSLRELSDAFAMHDPAIVHVLDRDTGRVGMISEDAERECVESLGIDVSQFDAGDEPDWLDVLPPRFVMLPDESERREVDAMRSFARTRSPGEDRDRLTEETYGRGLYRRFKREVARQNLVEAWLEYRDRHFAELAREWLREHQVPFVEDLPSAPD